MTKTTKRIGLFVWLKLGEILRATLWVTGGVLIVMTFGYFLAWFCMNVWDYIVGGILCVTLITLLALMLYEIYVDGLYPWLYRNWIEVKRRIP